MKTFAYAALIASAMAVRLTEVEEVATDAPVEDAATMDDLADLTLGDLEGEQEGLAECFLMKTGEALADRSMDEDEIMELGEELVAGAEAGATLGDAVERLREKGEEHGVDTEGQDEFLGDVLERVKGCKKERKEKREGKKDEKKGEKSGSEDEEEASGADLELAQEGEEVEGEESSAPEGGDLRELAGEAKAALEDLDSEEREELAEVVKAELEELSVDEDDLEAVKEAVKAGAEDALTEAFEALPEEAQEKVREGVEALKAAKAEQEGDDDGEGSDDGEGPEERKPKRGGDKQ